jgi:uncharacterized coiled-coil DUF342 family protein
MEEVAVRFDPDLLGPVAEWGNRAANAFSSAARAFQDVPEALKPGIVRLSELSNDLEKARFAVAELATALSKEIGVAAGRFAQELGEASHSTRELGSTVAALQPAADASRKALEELGRQTLQEVKQIADWNTTLQLILGELGNVDRTLRELAGAGAQDITAPLNRLVEALASASAKTCGSAEKVESLRGEFAGLTAANKELGVHLEADVARPLIAHRESLERVREELATASKQIAQVGEQLTSAYPKGDDRDERANRLTEEVSGLRREMVEANAQAKTLIGKIESLATNAQEPSLIGKLFGSGTEAQGK